METDTESYRQTLRQADRQTPRQTDRHRHTETDRDRDGGLGLYIRFFMGLCNRLHSSFSIKIILMAIISLIMH